MIEHGESQLRSGSFFAGAAEGSFVGGGPRAFDATAVDRQRQPTGAAGALAGDLDHPPSQFADDRREQHRSVRRQRRGEAAVRTPQPPVGKESPQLTADQSESLDQLPRLLPTQ